jgi:hypothetical protein
LKEQMVGLGRSTQSALASRKVSNVDILATSKIPATHLHHFSRSFWLSNFEYVEKSYLAEEIKEKDDPRSFRHIKTIDSMSLKHE